MAIQSLTPPQDITWTRAAFARDMIDTNFEDLTFGPKWRSSLAVYYYLVPFEDTTDDYPNSRIVYLKFTSSITGWNPCEDLLAAKKAAEESGTGDDLQRTLWEVIVSSGWAATYWPCLGAIMQLAVYPSNAQGVAPDDYPYIMDFEPKKRELFEQVTAGSEFLSGSAEKLSTTKGSTNTQSVDVHGGGSFMGIGLSASAGESWQQMDTRTSDASRENRETLSRSTSFSQMYQLFNGYHLGTNRALFVILPRPHTVSNSEQTDHNLINGERRLEGLQDVFLVLHMPRSMGGFCIQAGLDTAHLATVSTPEHLVMLKVNHLPDGGPDPGDGGRGGGGGGGGGGDPGNPVKQLVITRRVIQSCGTFDENGNFQLQPAPKPRPPVVVGEIAVNGLPTRALFVAAAANGGGGRELRVQVANNLNVLQGDINRTMLSAASSTNYSPRKFEDSDAFKSLAASAATSIDVPLADLVQNGYLDAQTAERLGRNKIRAVSDLFSHSLVGMDMDGIQPIRMGIISKLLRGKSR